MIKGDRRNESDCAQTLRAAHRRLKTRRGFASEYACIDCGIQALDWSRRHEETGMQADHYDPRCRSCHLKYDYTDERRAKISKANKGKDYNRSFLGRKHTAETIERMRSSASHRSRVDPD